MLRLDLEEKLKLGEQDSIILNSGFATTKSKTKIPTEAYVRSLHENDRNIRDLSTVFNDQDKEFDKKKLTNLVSIAVNRNPSSGI